MSTVPECPFGAFIMSEFRVARTTYGSLTRIRYTASIALLIPPLNLPAWKYRSEYCNERPFSHSGISPYLSTQIIAAKTSGWGATYATDPNVLQICEIILSHEKFSREDGMKTYSGNPCVPVETLEQVALIALEHDQDRIFRRACVRMHNACDKDTGSVPQAAGLVYALARRLFETADFEKVDFWLSLHRNKMQKVETIQNVVSDFNAEQNSLR